MLETSPKTPERLTFPGIQVAIDRGGTFCDVIARVDGREEVVFKLLSENPQEYRDAPTEALRRILSEIEQREIPRNQKLDGSRICAYIPCGLIDQEADERAASCRIGTTIATNALLELKGERFAFVTTAGKSAGTSVAQHR